jgi:transcriptional regulator GlxA family with amidase domain
MGHAALQGMMDYLYRLNLSEVELMNRLASQLLDLFDLVSSRPESGKLDARIQQALDLASDNPAAFARVGELAQAVNLSPPRFRALFKKETGQSPRDFLLRIRMEYVRHLLLSERMLLKEVAWLMHLDVAQLSRQFKRHYGSCPSEYVAGS